MSVQEGMRLYLSDRSILRSCLYVAALLGAALLIVWPRDSLESALRTGLAPESFVIVATCLLLCLLFLGARFGVQDFSTDPSVQLQEHVRLTSVPLARLIGGRAAFIFLHTLLLLLLGAPFLAAAMAVGGAEPPQLFRSLAVIGAAAVASRTLGLLVLCVFGARQPLREIALFPTLIALQIAAFLAVPPASPFHVLSDVTKTPGGSPEWLFSILANLGIAAAFCGLSVLALWAVRGIARRNARG
jgi:hypothetical protein